jgi:3-phenylpropionate/trans-cinnamate dioxygenase ferredoxin component
MSALIPLVALSDLPEGRGRRVGTAGLDLAVFRIGDAIYASDDSCPHQGASLSGGRLQGKTVFCRAHGLEFDLERGCSRRVPGLQVKTYAVRAVDGIVMLDLEAQV